MGLTTSSFFTTVGSYKHGFLEPGVLQPDVVETRDLTARRFYNHGSYN